MHPGVILMLKCINGHFFSLLYWIPSNDNMYEGFSKNNGDVIGDTSMGEHVDLGEAAESTAAEESLVCMNESGEELVFNAKLRRDTGELTWCQLYDKETIMQRTVGMSQMTSMMRDTDRNSIYEKSIAKLIDQFKKEHERPPVVLDIGAGTGLLSMLSLRHGAEFVIGVEMFDTMSAIAEKVVSSNDFGDKVLVINAKSNEIEDLPIQPDLLVSELLDSALLGEGCLPAHTDALMRLMNPLSDVVHDGCYRNRVAPYSGSMHATLIESLEVKHMHDVGSINLTDCCSQSTGGSLPLHPHRSPPSSGAPPCRGGWSLVPVHWTEMLNRGARELSGAVQVLHPNFTLSEPADHETFSQQNDWYFSDIAVTTDGTVHGILLWWKLFLLSPEIDPDRELTYCTAPGTQNWQDHWQQTVYPLAEDITVKVGDMVRVYAKHDAVQVQVYVVKASSSTASLKASSAEVRCAAPDCKRARPSEEDAQDVRGMLGNRVMVCCVNADNGNEMSQEVCDESRHVCMCGWHVLCGAERFQMMCDARRGGLWQRALDNLLLQLQVCSNTNTDVPAKVIMDLSDGSLLGLSLAAKIRAQGVSHFKVVSKESKFFSRMFFSQVADANGFDEQVVLWDGKLLQELADSLATDVETEEDQAEQEVEEEGGAMESDENADPDSEITPDALLGSVVAVVSECYYYQLHALPIWQALSFLFQVQAMRMRGLLHPDCRVLPGRAIVRAVALELPQLKNCHGLAGMYVLYFDIGSIIAHNVLYIFPSYIFAASVGSTTQI